MRHLKRFNEGGSHDWRANFFPGASEEEIEKELAKYDKAKEEKPTNDKKPDVKSEPRKNSIADDQDLMRFLGYPESQVVAYGEKDQGKKEETKEEEVETKDKGGIGSKIKSFLKFKK